MNSPPPSHVQELIILLFPTTNKEWTYVNTLARRYSEFFSRPVRCTYTSVPANALGLLFVAKLQDRLGKEKVIAKCVSRPLVSSDIPNIVKRFMARDRRLNNASITELLSKPVEL